MMRITESHRALYIHCRGPRWARDAKGFDLGQCLHTCINANVVKPYRHEDYKRVAGNTLSILRSTRKREPLYVTLTRMALTPGTTDNPNRRAASCRRWLIRLGYLMTRTSC